MNWAFITYMLTRGLLDPKTYLKIWLAVVALALFTAAAVLTVC